MIGLPGTGFKWQGGVLAPNGKVYAIPSQSTSVLIIDPATNTYDNTTISGLTVSFSWRGGVLAPNGKITGFRPMPRAYSLSIPSPTPLM